MVDGQVAQDADRAKRDRPDHPGEPAVGRLGHEPPGVADAAQEVEGPRVGRPADDAPELQDALDVRDLHPPDAEARPSP